MRQQPTRTPNPRRGLTLALLAIQTDHPELADAEWTVSQLGILYGSVSEPDARPLLDAYVDLMGGEVSEPIRYRHADDEWVAQTLYVTWQDVQLHVRFSSLPGAYPELGAVLAVAV